MQIVKNLQVHVNVVCLDLRGYWFFIIKFLRFGDFWKFSFTISSVEEAVILTIQK